MNIIKLLKFLLLYFTLIIFNLSIFLINVLNFQFESILINCNISNYNFFFGFIFGKIKVYEYNEKKDNNFVSQKCEEYLFNLINNKLA